MPRVARRQMDASVFLIVQKSHLKLFRSNQDRSQFLSYLKEAKLKYQFACYGFSLCDDDRFGLIIHVKHQTISKIMQSLMIAYAKYYTSDEPLYKERYKSYPIYNEIDMANAFNQLHQTDSPYASLCYYNGTREDSIQLIDYYTKQPFDLKPVNKTPLPDKVVALCNEHHCTSEEIKKNKTLRNQCILEIYRETGCSLKDLSILFEISTSMVSKIIKNEANQL